jgi:hypothetical protein
MENNILEDYTIEKMLLPICYKVISLVRVFWIIDIVYFFFKILILYKSSYYLKMDTFYKEIIPVTIILLPTIVYYFFQANFEFKRSLKSKKNLLLKMYSILTLCGIIYFGFEEVFRYFYETSFSLATVGIFFFYLFVSIIFFADIKYLWDRLVLYNSDSLKKTE